MTTVAKRIQSRSPTLLSGLLSGLLAVLAAMPACFAQGAAHSAPAAPAVQQPVLVSGARRLAAALQLTHQQQVELARILAVQRERMRKVWQQQNVLPEYRASETRAIKDETESQIRAMLSDEQRKRYFAPRPAGSPQPSESELDRWFNAAKPH